MRLRNIQRFVFILTGAVCSCFVNACRSFPEFDSAETKAAFRSIPDQPEQIRSVSLKMSVAGMEKQIQSSLWMERNGRFLAENKSPDAKERDIIVWDGITAYRSAKTGIVPEPEAGKLCKDLVLVFPFMQMENLKKVSPETGANPAERTFRLTFASPEYQDFKLAVSTDNGRIRSAQWIRVYPDGIRQPVAMTFSDDKEKDGFLFPGKIRIFAGKGTSPVEITIEEIMVNPETPKVIASLKQSSAETMKIQ